MFRGCAWYQVPNPKHPNSDPVNLKLQFSIFSSEKRQNKFTYFKNYFVCTYVVCFWPFLKQKHLFSDELGGCVKKEWNACKEKYTIRSKNPDNNVTKNLELNDGKNGSKVIQLSPQNAKIQVIPNKEKNMDFTVSVSTSLPATLRGCLKKKFPSPKLSY